jgi:hypothetical protein
MTYLLHAVALAWISKPGAQLARIGDCWQLENRVELPFNRGSRRLKTCAYNYKRAAREPGL